MMLAETYYDLVTNGAHWMFEITGEVVTAIAMFPFARRYQRWHDKKHHGQAHTHSRRRLTSEVSITPSGRRRIRFRLTPTQETATLPS